MSIRSSSGIGVLILNLGKTTVARLYARFLNSIGVLSGSEVVETTGSKLANDRVSVLRKQVDDVLKIGSGTVFVDEAYQLTAGHNPGGKAVLGASSSTIQATPVAFHTLLDSQTIRTKNF